MACSMSLFSRESDVLPMPESEVPLRRERCGEVVQEKRQWK